MITKYGCMLAALSLALASSALASLQTVNNDSWWRDQNGNPLYAQGGGISKFGSTYYMYGVEYGGAHTYYSSGTANSDTSFKNIPCYTSTDLVHWNWVSEAATPTELPGATWVGRIGNVIYNSSTGKYVLWVEYYGSRGSAMACLTASSPTSRFTFVKTQASIGNVFDSVEGDSTMFCDVTHSNKPYFICSDGHGRQHAYVATLSSDYQTINSATLIYVWPSDGQEANCMFEYNNVYHYVTSETNGWSYSQAYDVHSSNIFSGYSSDAVFNGTSSTHTYYSQISYFVHLIGSSQTTILAVGDRWADFSSNYKNAGHGTNFLIMCPVSMSSNTPTFNARGTWSLDAATGKWQ